MNDKKTTVDNLKVFVKDFVDERDWSQFHNPKNISMALAIEASELMDIFKCCLLYTSPSPRDATLSRMPSSA